MASNKESRAYLLVFLLVAIASLLLTVVAVLIHQDRFVAPVTIAIGTSILASLVVFILDRHVPRLFPQVEIIHGHLRIYDQYQKYIGQLDDGPHTIRATASSPEITKEWDDFLTNFLRSHEKVNYYRVLIKDNKNANWARRVAEIDGRYKGLANYKHRATEGLPSIECLLIDDTHAFITFASAVSPQECTGLLIRDQTICKELQHYFVNQLEKVLPPVPIP